MSQLSVTLIQTSLHWEDKQANLRMLQQKIESIEDKTHIVVLPEMFSTGFSMRPNNLAERMDGATIGWMKEMAASKRVILTGSVIIEEEGAFYNRLIWMLPNGSFDYYDKRHLFAYAGEDQHYKSGNKRFIASVNGWRINCIICYDLRFPVWARQQRGEKGNAEYDVLVCVANWPERRVNAWKTLLAARAIENQCFVIGVNRVGEDGAGIYHSGHSSVIDPAGEVLYQKEKAEDIFTVPLEKKALDVLREKLPFSRDADDFELLV